MQPIIDLGPKKGFLYDGNRFDSKEEIWFSWYLAELREAGFIAAFDYQPEPFFLSPPVTYNWIKPLKTKKKLVTTALVQAHSYQADFFIWWLPEALNIFIVNNGNKKSAPFVIHESLNQRLKSWIDVKGSDFSSPMRQLDNRLFKINQKWVFQKYGAYVQKIVPQELFAKTFTPERYLFTDKSLKPRKINFEVRSLTAMKGASQ